MKRVAILFSGRGSNMQKIIENLSNEIDIVKCITDKSEAKGLEICKEHNIDTYILKDKKFNSELIEVLDSLNIDLVICAGFMRILSKEFVAKFKAINIHPSLLPRHRGLHAIERSFEDEHSNAGITIHFVDEGVDTGSIIMQKEIEKIESESIEAFENRIHALEHKYYSLAVKEVLEIS